MSDIFGNIPIFGSILGGGSSSGGLLGGILGGGGLNFGIENLIFEVVMFFVVIDIVFKLIDLI